MYSCDFDDYNVPDDKTASLEIYIHDAPAPVIMELNLMFSHITLDKIDEGNNVIDTLGDDPDEIEIDDEITGKPLNILDYTQNNPVLLSRVAGFTPGKYRDLRIKLADGCTVGIDHDGNGSVSDNERHKLVIDYGHIAELVWAGPFEVPANKLFRIDVDFDVNNSVCFEPGVGYVLVPVIRIDTDTSMVLPEMIGCYKGKIPIDSPCGTKYTSIIKLDYNGEEYKFWAKSNKNKDVYSKGNYSYDTNKKEIKLTDIEAIYEIDCCIDVGLFTYCDPICELIKSQLNKDIGDKTFKVKEWNKHRIIVNGCDETLQLLKMEESNCNLDDQKCHETTVTVPIDYPDNSMDGKTVYVELVGYGSKNIYTILKDKLENGKIAVQFRIPCENFDNYENSDISQVEPLEVKIEAYLTKNSNDMSINTDGILSGSCLKTLPRRYKYSIEYSKDNVLDNPPITFDDGFNISIDPPGMRGEIPVILRWNKIKDYNDNILNKYYVFVSIDDMNKEDTDGIYNGDDNKLFFSGDGNIARDIVQQELVEGDSLKIIGGLGIQLHNYSDIDLHKFSNDVGLSPFLQYTIPNNTKVYVEIIALKNGTTEFKRQNIFRIGRATFVK